MPSDNWTSQYLENIAVCMVAGPMATTTNQDDYVRTTRNMNSIGYGAAGTISFTRFAGEIVTKSISSAYEEEMFGDEDLEMGDISI